MPRQFGLVTCLLCSVMLAADGSAAESAADNRAVASGRNDVVYLAPATESYEALPLGNGRLGITVWNERGVTYQLNHGSFFASKDENHLLISSGRVDLLLPAEWMKGFVEERLALHSGEVVTEFKTSDAKHRIRSWVAEGLDMLVIQIESDKRLPDITMQLSNWYTPPDPPGRGWGRRPEPELAVSAREIFSATVGTSKRRATAIVAAPLEGEVKTAITGERIVAMTTANENRKRMTILVANPVVIGNAVDGADALRAALAVIQQARTKGEAALEKQHVDYWHSFWSKSEVLLHSEDGFGEYLENLYNLHLYWMASSSHGKDAPKFNGGNFLLYQDDRSWGGPYYYNNEREMYWSLLPANHAELWTPFMDLYWRNLPAARKLAREMYDCTGACFEEAMTRDGGGDKRTNPSVGLYLTTGTEMAFQMYQYYLFTKDKTFLREKLYPLLKETVTFHLNFLNKEADGFYHVYPSNARENFHWIKDSVTDLAALRAVLPALIRTSGQLGVDAKEREKWQDVLSHLAPFVEDTQVHTILGGTFFDVYPPTRFAKIEALYLYQSVYTLAAQAKGYGPYYFNTDFSVRLSRFVTRFSGILCADQYPVAAPDSRIQITGSGELEWKNYVDFIENSPGRRDYVMHLTAIPGGVKIPGKRGVY